MTRGVRCGIQISSDSGNAKIRDACMTRVVHKDVRLAKCQHGSEMRSRTTTYPPEVPMNYIAGVEVAEALSDVRQLVTGLSIR